MTQIPDSRNVPAKVTIATVADVAARRNGHARAAASQPMRDQMNRPRPMGDAGDASRVTDAPAPPGGSYSPDSRNGGSY